jgi:hypothetical protein
MIGRRLLAPERFAFAALVLLTLSPALVQGVWRSLAQAIRVEVPTGAVEPVSLSYAALAVTLAVLLVHGTSSRRWLPGAVGGVLCVPAALLAARGGPAVGVVLIALLGVTLAATLLLPWLIHRLPGALDGLALRRKGVAALMLVLALATVAQTTRLGVFMGDATRTDLSLVPEVPFLASHSCLTAYVEGARLAAEGAENLYDAGHWPELSGSTQSAEAAAGYAPLHLDAFAYPPPFLLLPRLVLSPLGDFAAQRALWFALNALLIAAGMFTLSRWLGGRAGVRALLLAPLLWCSQATLVTLQVGNVHVAVVVAAMLSLVAFESKRPALGGALLAFAVLAKLSPGVLVLVLVVQRRHREVAWTLAFGAGYLLLTLAWFGPAPFAAFLSYELPRLGSGEALAFLAGPESVAINLAPFGLPFKLAALGLDLGDAWAIARNINVVFTLAIVVLAIVGARRVRLGDRSEPQANAVLFTALLTLAALRSPLAPAYVSFGLLWLLTLRADEVRGWAGALAMVAVWTVVAYTPPLAVGPVAVYTLAQQFVVLGAAVYFVLRPRAAKTSSPLTDSRTDSARSGFRRFQFGRP